MFVTKDRFRVEDSLSDEASEHAQWDIVDIPYQIPWFVVSFIETVGPRRAGEMKQRTMLLHRVDQLENFIRSLESDSTGIKDVQVEVVLPSYMSGKANWLMEPLTAILNGYFAGDSSERYDVFETSSGSKFAEHLSATALVRLQTVNTRLNVSPFQK